LFLAGQARLADLFTIVGGAGQDSSEAGLLPLELLPKAGDMPYTRVQLGVDPETYLVSRVRLTDALGHTTTMWFSDIDTQGPVDPVLFHFQVPPGVDVMSPPMFPVPK
jgi:outer membrane lipoprotein-sorting protein